MQLAGYPDWQRVQYAGGLQIANVTEDMSGGVNLGFFNVQAWATLLCSVNVNAGSSTYQVQFAWYTAGVGGAQIAVTNLVYTATNTGTMYVPVLGPWVFIQVTSSPTTDHTPVTVSIYTSANLLSGYDALDRSTPLASDVSAYGINQNKVVTTNRAYAGNAILFLDVQSQDLCTATIEFWNFAVTPAWVEMSGVRLSGASGDMTALVAIPACPIRLHVFNGPTAQNVGVALTATT
jgi:hypothetical protein